MRISGSSKSLSLLNDEREIATERPQNGRDGGLSPPVVRVHQRELPEVSSRITRVLVKLSNVFDELEALQQESAPDAESAG
jgi:hypothetical protein